jgi:Methyltransferase domain
MDSVSMTRSLETSFSQAVLGLSEGYEGQAFVACAACPICGGESHVLFPAKNIHPEKPVQFDYRRCLGCGHGWIDPMPTQGFLVHLYGRASRSVIGQWGEDALTIPERFFLRRESAHRPKQYFELGVGQGHLYGALVQKGWNCIGVDPGNWSSRFPNVYRDIESILQSVSADLIAAFDVLEHVSDPIAILRTLRGLAATSARIYCATPNCTSWRARRHRQNWRMVRPLGHVNYFSKRSIILAMEKAGFRVRYLRATDLFRFQIPRRRAELGSALAELTRTGDQWIVMAEAT